MPDTPSWLSRSVIDNEENGTGQYALDDYDPVYGRRSGASLDDDDPLLKESASGRVHPIYGLPSLLLNPVVFGLGAAAIIAVLCAFTVLNRSTALIQHISEATAPRYLRVIVPGSEADANLCKSLLSCAICGYPTPFVANFGKLFEDPHMVAGGSHLAKIDGVLDHLSLLEANHDNDLVVIMDGLDVWFQLRPSVLIQRYIDINRRADERIRRQIGTAAMEKEGIRQKVIFAAQKRCWPKDATHPACYAVPESSLPKNVYGHLTDQDSGDEKNPYVNFRQRYLNSGSCVGPVAAVRDVFRRAKSKMEQDRNFGSDQKLFAEIFGEQEFQRHVVAKRYRTLTRRVVDWIAKRLRRPYSYQIIDPSAAGDHETFLHAAPNTYEFGIGLDYESLIQQVTVFAEDETAWIDHSNRTAVEAVCTGKGFPPQCVGPIATDILRSLAPFYSARRGEHATEQLPVHQTWSETSLFTNLRTGISPVAVHHNAHRDGLKSRIQTSWPSTYYASHLRAMLDARASTPQHVVAVTFDPAGREQSWWSPMISSSANDWASVWTAGRRPIDYEELCGGDGIWDQVMLDGLGKWRDSRLRSPVFSNTSRAT